MLQKFTLPNGIQVVAYDMPSVRSFHLRVSVKGGSLVESDQDNGIAHFMEHILVQGIPSYPTPESLSQFIESLAGSYNAFTSQLLVSFSITVPNLHAKDATKIASEVFFHPLFSEKDIERERSVVINEIKQDMDSRWYKFSEFFKEKRFIKESKLRIKTVGSIDVVARLTKRDLVSYWEKYFFPKNTYILVIGNLSEIDLKGLIAEYFGDIQSEKVFEGFENHGTDDLSKRTVAIRNDPELQVNYIDLTFPSLSMKDSLQERIEENIADVILGGLSSSRLFRLLRHEKGLVYGVTSQNTRYPFVGYGSVSSEVAPDCLEEVLTLITTELQTYLQTGPTTAEVDFTKHYLTNSWLMSFDHPGSIANWIESELLWKDDREGERILLPDDYIALLENITKKTITKTLQNHWDFSKVNLLLQGPLADTREDEKKYASIIEKLR